jgi:hypothetical protein
MQNSKTEKSTITSGPGKWDLFIHFGRKNDESITFHVTTAGGLKIKLEVVVYAMERESGGGENWNISGSISAISRTKPEPTNFTAYYKTSDRTGHITY